MRPRNIIRISMAIIILMACSGFGSFSSTSSVYIPSTSDGTSKNLSARNVDIMSVSPLGNFYSEADLGISKIDIRSFKPENEPNEEAIEAYIKKNYDNYPDDVKQRLTRTLVNTKKAEKYLREQTINFVATDEEVLANGEEWVKVIKNAHDMEAEISHGRDIEKNLMKMERYLKKTLSGSLLTD